MRHAQAWRVRGDPKSPKPKCSCLHVGCDVLWELKMQQLVSILSNLPMSWKGRFFKKVKWILSCPINPFNFRKKKKQTLRYGEKKDPELPMFIF